MSGDYSHSVLWIFLLAVLVLPSLLGLASDLASAGRHRQSEQVVRQAPRQAGQPARQAPRAVSLHGELPDCALDDLSACLADRGHVVAVQKEEE